MSDKPKREISDKDIAIIDQMACTGMRVLVEEIRKYLDEHNIMHEQAGALMLPVIIDTLKSTGEDQTASAHILIASSFNDKNTFGILGSSLQQLQQKNYRRISKYGLSTEESAWAAPWSRGDA